MWLTKNKLNKLKQQISEDVEEEIESRLEGIIQLSVENYFKKQWSLIDDKQNSIKDRISEIISEYRINCEYIVENKTRDFIHSYLEQIKETEAIKEDFITDIVRRINENQLK